MNGRQPRRNSNWNLSGLRTAWRIVALGASMMLPRSVRQRLDAVAVLRGVSGELGEFPCVNSLAVDNLITLFSRQCSSVAEQRFRKP